MQDKFIIKKIVNNSQENVAKFKYYRRAEEKENFVHKEFKRELNSGNTWHISV
jgi:hypothetical protein